MKSVVLTADRSDLVDYYDLYKGSVNVLLKTARRLTWNQSPAKKVNSSRPEVISNVETRDIDKIILTEDIDNAT